MLRKIALGLVAAASLSAMALAPTAASAHGHGGGHGGGHHGHHFGHFGHGHGFGVAYIDDGYDDGCYVVRPVPTPFGFRMRTINVCD